MNRKWIQGGFWGITASILGSAWTQRSSFTLESSQVPDLLNNEAVAMRRFHTFVMVRTTSVEVTSGWTVPVILYPTTCGRTMEIACPSMTASASIPPTPDKNKTTNIANKTTNKWMGKGSCLKNVIYFCRICYETAKCIDCTENVT